MPRNRKHYRHLIQLAVDQGQTPHWAQTELDYVEETFGPVLMSDREFDQATPEERDRLHPLSNPAR